MIIVVAMMMVFKSVAAIGLSARETANADSKYISSALSASLALQEAGYGIMNPQLDSQLIVVSGATLSSNSLSGTAVNTSNRIGNAVIWEIRITGTLQCAGLYAPSSGGLLSLPAVNCTGANAWNTLTWVPVTLVPTPPSSSDSEKLDRIIPIIFTITARVQNCKPFGVTNASGNVWLSITANSSNSEQMNLSTEQCLINFSVP